MASKAHIYRADELEAMRRYACAKAEDTTDENGPGYDLAKEALGMIVTLIDVELARRNFKTQ